MVLSHEDWGAGTDYDAMRSREPIPARAMLLKRYIQPITIVHIDGRIAHNYTVAE